MALFRNKQTVSDDDLLADMPRGVVGRAPEENMAPDAQWMTPDEVRRYAYSPLDGDRVFFGKQGRDFIGIADDRHVLLAAGSRAGKGQSFIVPNLLSNQASALVIDPKGENARLTARYRAERMGQKVYILDPFGRTGKSRERYRSRFNPLSILKKDSDSLVADAGLIADSLVTAAEKDPHWDDNARTLIQGISQHVATYPDYEVRRDLVTVRELLRKGRNHSGLSGMKGLYSEMAANKEATGIVAATAAEMQDKPENELGSILSTARRHTSFLDMKQMQDVLSGHDFDLKSLKTGKATIYLCLPAYHLGRCSRWLRLFVNLLLQAMEQEETKPSLPVLMILDEFAVLGHMTQLEAAIGQIAGFGVKLAVIVQDLGQIKALYGERWESFVANAGVVQCFGNTDMTTCDYISRMLGKTSVLVAGLREISPEDRRKGVTGHGKSHSMANLLEGTEIAKKFSRGDRRRRQLLLLAGEKPVVLQRAVAFSEAPFRERIDTD